MTNDTPLGVNSMDLKTSSAPEQNGPPFTETQCTENGVRCNIYVQYEKRTERRAIRMD